MPGIGGFVCSTKPGSLLVLTTVSSFESGLRWKLLKSGKAESSGRRGEAVVVENRIRNKRKFIFSVRQKNVGNKKVWEKNLS